MTTASEIESKLASKYLTELTGWALLREVTIEDPEAIRLREIPYGDMTEAELAFLCGTTTRRIDVLLMRTSAFAKPIPFERLAVEIKVSRGDFFRDTAEKRRLWHAAAHRFAYATPPGLVTRDEIPADCGLIEVDPSKSRFQGVAWAKRAPRRKGEPEPFSDRFTAYLAGRASRAEHSLRTGAVFA